MRQSLAPVSSNAMNSRASLAPGRASMAPGKIGGGGKRQSSFGGRQSMAPGRRSTLAAGGPTKQMEDPRNVREKGFVRQSLQRLIEFLVENNYDRQISPKQLEAPTTKDFLHILTFLYNQIDPRFVLGANVAEEVPAMFKRLRYPFNISKSHLQAVGSPHAWPSLLAALVWLTELLQYERQTEQAKEEDALSTNVNSDKVFFDFLSKAYVSFLDGTDEAEGDALENELAQNFAEKDAAMMKEVERVRMANEKMEEEIVDLSDSKLEDLQEKRELLIKDLDKFKLLISNLEKHHTEVEKKTEELKVDSAAKEAELRACEAEREELSHTVAGQEAANIDAYRITAERARLMEELKRAATEKDRIQSIIYEAEIQLSNKQVDVERSVSEYHDLGRELKLMPSTAKYANGVDLEIPLQTRGNSIDQLVTLGGRTTLKHDLMALHTSLGARVREAVEDKIGHEESEREMAESVTEKRRDVRATEEECRSREAALAKEKDSVEEQLREMAAEVQEIEEQLASGQTSSSRRLKAAEKRVEELQAMLAEATDAAHKKRGGMVEVLISISHMVAQHKLTVQERLQQLQHTVAQTQEHIATA